MAGMDYLENELAFYWTLSSFQTGGWKTMRREREVPGKLCGCIYKPINFPSKSGHVSVSKPSPVINDTALTV